MAAIREAVTTGTTPLGVQYLPQASTFSVFADASAVRVRLIHPGSRALAVWPLQPLKGESTPNGAVWSLTLEGDWRGWSYSYEIDRAGRTIADIVDPWALLVRQDRGFVAHESTPVTPRPPLNPSEAILYELHLRDFTRDPSCGVRPDWRGRYLGLSQSGTRLESTTYTTGLDHIVELGVNVVQLMPVHSFKLPYHPEYEWGYMPNDFNAPHDGYASGLDLEAPIREFKRLVSTLHERGLRVTLDVVYNHTAEKWPTKMRSFMALAPKEYYRWKPDGSPWNGSNCGNEFRSESHHGRRFIIESCKYWVQHFGIDGFRFDLMGLIDQETMTLLSRELHDIDPTILVYGEPWAGGETPIIVNDKSKQRSRGWGAFNDDFRDGFRGEVFKPKEPGFLASGQNILRCKSGIRGGVSHWTDSPLECINYLECHDNHTLSDRLALTSPPPGPDSKIGPIQRAEMNQMGALALMTSAGIPFIHSGQEFGRSKDGEDNTYNLGDQINNILWADKAERHQMYTFYREAIRLRKDHPMFRPTSQQQTLASIKFLDDDLKLTLPSGTMGWLVTDVEGKDTWAAAVVLLNGSSKPATIPLPPGEWKIRSMDGRFEQDGEMRRGSIELMPHWGSVVFQAR